MKDFPKVNTWRLDWDSKLRPCGLKAPSLLGGLGGRAAPDFKIGGCRGSRGLHEILS